MTEPLKPPGAGEPHETEERLRETARTYERLINERAEEYRKAFLEDTKHWRAELMHIMKILPVISVIEIKDGDKTTFLPVKL